jgi:hypothetical protein
MVNKWQVFILKQFQKSKAIIFKHLYYGIPDMYGYLVATVRFHTSLNIWISYATYNLVSKKFYNVTASAFLLYTLMLYNVSLFRFIDHLHLCTVLICHIRHVHSEQSLPLQVILPSPVDNSFSVLYRECTCKLFEKFNAWLILCKVDWH